MLPTSVFECSCYYFNLLELYKLEIVCLKWCRFLQSSSANLVWRFALFRELGSKTYSRALNWRALSKAGWTSKRCWLQGNYRRMEVDTTVIVSSVSLQYPMFTVASWDSGVELFDIRSDCIKSRMVIPSKFVNSVKLIPSHKSDSSFIATGSRDARIRLWNSFGQLLTVFSGHVGSVRSIALWNDKLISGSYDGFLRLWNIETGQCEHIFQGHTAGISSVSAHDTFLSCGSDRTVREWDSRTAGCIIVRKGHTSTVNSVVANSFFIASASDDLSIRIWDRSSQSTCVYSSEQHTDSVRCLSLYGKRLVSGSWDHTIRIWNLASSFTCLQEFCAGKWIEAVDTDATRLVSGDMNGREPDKVGKSVFFCDFSCEPKVSRKRK
eukprot:TRINITY_DN3253_c1_g1_i1.p1 TRINITY_DN3253_c1_g1~~TRINITY_DN3253_c1_g1_i1.p1  ORF type:complete len:380 (-),score=7.14 TRINITY_DN3253_c1_g1_i1:115-1254(-)